MRIISIILISYLIGSISTSYLVGKIFHKEDIRTKGSGNAGTTNVLRNYGFKSALLTFLIDLLKGTLSVWIASRINTEFGIYIAGVSVVIGHIWSIYLRFTGGKGVATTAGVYLFIDYRIFLIEMVFFILIALTTKYVSLASIIVSLIAIIGVKLIQPNNVYFLILAILNTSLIIFKHRDNIKRLLAGRENKLKI